MHSLFPPLPPSLEACAPTKVPAPHFSTPLPCALLGTRRATPHSHGPPTRHALRPPHRSGTRATGRRDSTAARAAQRSQPSSSSVATGPERRRGSPWRASSELAHDGLGRLGSRGPSARHAGCTLDSVMALALHCTGARSSLLPTPGPKHRQAMETERRRPNHLVGFCLCLFVSAGRICPCRRICYLHCIFACRLLVSGGFCLLLPSSLVRLSENIELKVGNN